MLWRLTARRFTVVSLLALAFTPGVLLAQGAGPTFGERTWASAEYLLWWIKDGPPAPPLVTRAPASSTSFIPGAIGQVDTTVVLGGTPASYPVFSGARFTLGAWLDDDSAVGVEAGYFFLGDRKLSRSVASNGQFLTNPFFDVFGFGVPGETANFLGVPPPGTIGTATLATTSRFQGAEGNALLCLWDGASARLSLLGGFRFLNLRETLSLVTTQEDPTALFFPGQFVNTRDDFSAQNYLYAGQLGARAEVAWGFFFLQATGKVALGSMQQVVTVRGLTTTNSGAPFAVRIPVATVPGGIFAEPTNSRRFERDVFAVAPEGTVQAGVQWGILRAFVGYDFLYVSDVARPGNQIDRTINSTQLTSFTGVPTGPLVGQPRPVPLSRDSSYWAQGVNFGLAVTY